MLDFASAAAGPVSVRLFDAAGRVVLERRYGSIAGSGVPLDLGNLSPGVYLCRVTSGRETAMRRLVRM